MDLMENPILLIILVVVVLYFVCSRSENMQNATADKIARQYQYGLAPDANMYDPRAFQPAIAEQVYDDNFIELNKSAEKPWAHNVGPYGAVQGDFSDGALDPVDLGLNFNVCSRSCCSSSYPPPFAVTPDDFILRSGKEYVPSSYACNDGFNSSGCVCMTPKQSLFLAKRGNNAYNEI